MGHTEETKQKISEKLKGRKRTEQQKANMRKPKTITDKLKKYWESKKGKKMGKRSEETRKLLSELAKKRNLSPEYNRMLRSRTGEKAPFWKGGLSKNEEYLREYREKRRYGFTRKYLLEFYDNKCSVCGKTNDEHLVETGKNLAVHHKDGNGRNKKQPNNNIENLMIICITCHSREHKNIEKYNESRRISKKLSIK